jgi:hypothetical protein
MLLSDIWGDEYWFASYKGIGHGRTPPPLFRLT